MRIARWILLIPTTIASWFLVLYLSMNGYFIIESALCPTEDVVSDICMNDTVDLILSIYIQVCTGLSAAVVVLTATFTAPSHKKYTAWITFGMGVIVAAVMVFTNFAWNEWNHFFSAVFGGLIGAGAITYFLKRKTSPSS